MTNRPGYYVVKLTAFAFDTKDEAEAFHDKLLDAFCAMPESENIGAASRVEFEETTHD